LHIDIPDDYPSKLDYIKIQLAHKAMLLSGNSRLKASKIIGISYRAFRNWCNRYKELNCYKMERETDEQRLKRIKNEHWRVRV
jgi:hypothetical protein